ncbi:MAG: class I SAM-dependent methyltransferase [Acidimicrobiales bacterium]
MLTAVTLNPATQYATETNLRARQRLWEQQDPPFDLVGWVLEVAAVAPGMSVLDVGCGNGAYLRALAERGIEAVGCDLSLGMLTAAGASQPRIKVNADVTSLPLVLTNADVTLLPLDEDSVDVVLAPHMLYHVDDRATAARELRRVLRPAGVCVAVTNGRNHMRSLCGLIEDVVRTTDPGWEMLDPATSVFSLETGGTQLEVAFDHVDVVRPTGNAPVRLTDAAIVGGYVASVADYYQPQVSRQWNEVVEAVRAEAQRVIDADGAFVIQGDPGALVCR